VILLVSEYSLKSPLHITTIASILLALAGSLFHQFGFFMDCLRLYIPYVYKVFYRVMRLKA